MVDASEKFQEELIKIKKDIRDVKHSQEAGMQWERENYKKLTKETISSEVVARVFLAIDGLKNRKEVQDAVGKPQATVWRAFDRLESKSLIIDSEETKNGSPIYVKPRWVHVLRIDDYVRELYPEEATQPAASNSNSEHSS